MQVWITLKAVKYISNVTKKIKESYKDLYVVETDILAEVAFYIETL